MLLLIALACQNSDPDPGGDSAPVDSAPAADDSEAGDSATPDDDSDRFSFGEVSLCEAPLETVSFTEVGAEWGLESPIDQVTDHEENSAIAAGDLNGDGLTDLVIVAREGYSFVYTHQGDSFRPDRDALTPGSGPLLADIDDDGDLDLVVGGQTPYLGRNRGGSLSLESLGDVPPAGTSSLSYVHDLSIGDLEGDGVMDLFGAVTYDFAQSGEEDEDLLLRPENGGLMLVRGVVPEEISKAHSFDGVWFDGDGDGDLDYYMANDLGMNFGSSGLLRNDDGVLVDARDDCFCEVMTAAKGVDLGDYNRDGLPDLYVTGSPLNTLLAGLEGGGWVDVSASSQASQLTDGATGWGGHFFDYDNDGQLDILSAEGDRWNVGNDHKRFDVPLKLLRQDAGVFSDVAEDLGLDAWGSFRATLATDLNSDGVEDILVTQMDGRPLLYLSDGCTAAGWLEVEAPHGSVVRVTAGGETFTDWVRADAGYQATGPVVAHFGLGDAETVDALEVTLPGGEVLSVTQPFEARRLVRLIP